MSRNTNKAEAIGLLVGLAVTVFLYYAAIHFIVKFW